MNENETSDLTISLHLRVFASLREIFEVSYNEIAEAVDISLPIVTDLIQSILHKQLYILIWKLRLR